MMTNLRKSRNRVALLLALVLAAGCGGNKSEPQPSEAEKGGGGGIVSRLLEKKVEKTVPAGTVLTVEFQNTVSTTQSHPGDHFSARVVEPVRVDGVVVIPAGSVVSGTVVEAVPTKKIGGRARLGLDFTSLEPVGGDETPIQASFHAQGKSETKKDAATIGGAAAGGAILGRMLNRRHEAHGTVAGAVVGGAVGTAVAAHTKGEEIVLGKGSRLRIRLESPVKVSVRS